MKSTIKYLVVGLLAFCLLCVTYYLAPEKSLPAEIAIDSLVLLKNERKLFAYGGGFLLKSYTVSLGFSPEGHKQHQGDGKTPEGKYFINNKNPKSQYHLNLGINYPNEQDKQAAKTIGKTPGGDIKIHGLKNGLGYIEKFHRWKDWTAGCIALTNEEIEELYPQVTVGTPIIIKP